MNPVKSIAICALGNRRHTETTATSRLRAGAPPLFHHW